MKIQHTLAEMLGTFILVLVGCGSAVLAGPFIGITGIALTFGFTLMMLIYTLGPISGCHINPAVTISMVLMGKTSARESIWYIAAQLLGGILGGFALYCVASGNPAFNIAEGFAANGFGEHSPARFSALSCFIVETLTTTILLLIVLATTKPSFPWKIAGLSIGFTLIAVHLFSIPVTNTSVNFARSLGTAVIAGSAALKQLWLFALAQLLASVIAVVIHKALAKK